jgi:hypothetical protein
VNVPAKPLGTVLAVEPCRLRAARWYMQAFASATAVIGVCGVTGMLLTSHTPLRSVSPAEIKMASMTIPIPQSVQIEQAAIHSELVDATKAPGPCRQGR